MINISFKSDVGQKRKINEDTVLVYQNENNTTMAVVADGMGGMQGGEVASNVVAEHLGFLFKKTNFTSEQEIINWMKQRLIEENKNLIEQADRFKDLKGMGTTVVVAVFLAGKVIVLNVGDSRAYVYKDNKLSQLTEDHSLVNELVKKGQLTRQAAKNHPQKNVLTRAIGAFPKVDADVFVVDLALGEDLIMCTDGLTNMVSDEEMSEVLAKNISDESKVDELINMANQAGGDDNISVLIASEVSDE